MAAASASVTAMTGTAAASGSEGGPVAAKPVVFWGSGSPPAWRVCAVLIEKGVDFDSRRVFFDSGFLKTPDFLALNPRGLVPTFIADGVVIYESLAILHYLEDRYPAVPLMPKTPAARARALMRMQEANNASSAAGEVVYYVRRTRPEDINLQYLSCKFSVLGEELKLWDSYLADCEYLAGPGEPVSLADFAFFPNLCYMVRLGLELTPAYPRLAAYFGRMCTRPSIQATWPPHWQTTKGLPCLSLSIFPEGFHVAGAAPRCPSTHSHEAGGRNMLGECSGSAALVAAAEAVCPTAASSSSASSSSSFAPSGLASMPTA